MELDTCLDSNMRTLSLFSLDVVINHNRFCVEFLLSLVSPVSANVIGKLCLFMLSYHTSAKGSWKHDDLYLGWKKTPLPLPIRHLVMVYTPWYWVKCILSMPVDPLLSFFFFLCQALSDTEEDPADSSKDHLSELSCEAAREQLVNSIRQQWRILKSHVEKLDNQGALLCQRCYGLLTAPVVFYLPVYNTVSSCPSTCGITRP